jgi:hypothetical protein
LDLFTRENSPSTVVCALTQELTNVLPSGRVQEHMCRENNVSEENVLRQKQQRSTASFAPSVESKTVESDKGEKKMITKT